MKDIIMTMVIFMCSCSSKSELQKDFSQNRPSDYPLLILYVDSEYVKPAEIEKIKLEKYTPFWREKFKFPNLAITEIKLLLFLIKPK